MLKDNLDELLPGLDTLENLLPQGLILYFLEELLDDLQGDIRLQKGYPYLAKRLADILLGNLLPGNIAEDPGKTLGDAFKHALEPPADKRAPQNAPLELRAVC